MVIDGSSAEVSRSQYTPYGSLLAQSGDSPTDRRGEEAKRKAAGLLHVPYVKRTLGA